MDLYVQLLVNTVQIGAVYVLFSLGLTLIFGVMKIVNFAHGEFFTAAALTVTVVMPIATQHTGLPLWLSYVLAFLAAQAMVLALGYVAYRVGFVRYLNDLVGSFILSIGIVLLLQGLFLDIFGGAPRAVPPIMDGTLTLLGAAITNQRLVIVVIAISVTAMLYWLVHRTRLGLALRAVSEDSEAAMLQGIPLRRTALYGFLIGSLLAASAGALMAPLAAVTTFMGGGFLIKAFIIIIVGGLGSIPGAIVAGVLIALIESVGGYVFDPSTATIAMFVLVMLVLLLRPQGILRHAER